MGISAGISTGKNKYIKGVGIPSKGRTNFGVRFSDETDVRRSPLSSSRAALAVGRGGARRPRVPVAAPEHSPHRRLAAWRGARAWCLALCAARARNEPKYTAGCAQHSGDARARSIAPDMPTDLPDRAELAQVTMRADKLVSLMALAPQQHRILLSNHSAHARRPPTVGDPLAES